MDAGGLLVAFVVATLIGTTVGWITGLVPGLHVNTTAFLLVGLRDQVGRMLAVLLAGLGPSPAEVQLLTAAVIMSLATAQLLASAVPSVFLGAPNPEIAPALLPGHRLLLEGRGLEAVRLSVWGALGGLLVALALVPLVRLAMGAPLDGYRAARPFIPFLLIAVGILLVTSERHVPAPGEVGAAENMRSQAGSVRLSAAAVLGLSGLYGVIVLSVPGVVPVPLIGGPISEPGSLVLFPLFAGLFGIPGLLASMMAEPTVPPQRRSSPVRLDRHRRTIVAGAVAGSILGWFPAMSAATGATILSSLTRQPTGEQPRSPREDARRFLVTVAAVGSGNSMAGLLALFVIDRTLSGAVAAVDSVLGTQRWLWTGEELPMVLGALLLVTLLAAVIAAPLAIWSGHQVARHVHRLPYRWTAGAVLVVLVAFLAIGTGPVGLLVAGGASIIGGLPFRLGVRRIQLMGSLLVPVSLILLGLDRPLRLLLAAA